MKLSILAGATSQSVNIFVRDSTSTTGGGLAGIAPAGGSLLTGTKLDYSFTGASAGRVNVSLSVLATVGAAYSSGGIVQIDNTNMIGWIRIDLPNAALAAGSGRVVSFLLWGGTNLAPVPFEIELTGWNNQDGVHGGMSALPNTAVTTNASLLTSGAGTDQLSVSAGKILLQATQAGVTIPTVTTVTNQLTAAQVATGVWQDTTSGDFTVVSSIGKSLYTSGVVPGGAGGIFIAGTNAATTVTTSFTTTFTGNLTGSVASVTARVTANADQIDGAAWSNHAVGMAPADLRDISGSAVSASTAQLGVNVVNVSGSASTGAAGYVGVDWGQVTNKTTINALTGTTISTSQVVASVTGNVGGNVVGSVASVTARVTANTDQLAGQTVTAAAGVTFPTSVASPTNITAGTITTVTTATNVTTVNGLAANVITAASIADGAIDTATFAAGTTIPRVTLADAITTYTGNTVQTGDSFARIGVAGAGLTALGDTRIANLDVAVSTRLASSSYTAAPSANDVADTVYRRHMASVESSSTGDSLSLSSLYGFIQQAQKSSVSGTSLTVKKTDGTTTLGTLTIIVTAGADPITSVS